MLRPSPTTRAAKSLPTRPAAARAAARAGANSQAPRGEGATITTRPVSPAAEHAPPGAAEPLQQPTARRLASPLAALPLLLLAAAPQPAHALELADAVSGLQDLIANAGAAGPALFVAAYVAATVLFIPGSLLTVAAGFLYGPLLGTALVSVASTCGAAAAFLVGRYLARPAIERRLAGNARFAAVDAALAREGPRIVLLLRLSPLFPFSLLNYGLSLTGVRFWPYVLSSWAGMLPGTVAYVALGGAGKAAAETAAGGGAGAVALALYAVGAGATLWATKLISQAAGNALAEAEAAADDSAGTQPLGGGPR